MFKYERDQFSCSKSGFFSILLSQDGNDKIGIHANVGKAT